MSITTPIFLRLPMPFMARSIMFWNMVRFGRPVSPSDSACSSFSAAWRRRRWEAPATIATRVPHRNSRPSASRVYSSCVWSTIWLSIGPYGIQSSREPEAGVADPSRSGAKILRTRPRRASDDDGSLLTSVTFETVEPSIASRASAGGGLVLDRTVLSSE